MVRKVDGAGSAPQMSPRETRVNPKLKATSAKMAAVFKRTEGVLPNKDGTLNVTRAPDSAEDVNETAKKYI